MPYFDIDLETMDLERLQAYQRRRLAEMLQLVLGTNAFYTRKLAGISFDPLTDPFDRLPLTTREEIQADQLEQPPYGTNLTCPPDQYVRMHQTSASSGLTPLRWLDSVESWTWFKRCWQFIYQAAGVQAGDRFLFPFSFGPFVGFWAAFESALDLGCLTLAAGGMTSSARLRMILDHGITVVGCTPTYALRLADVARQEGIGLDRSPVRTLIVAGEPGGSLPATRAKMESAWGARVFDHTGMTEIGSCSFECLEAPGGVHIIETEFIPEVVDSASGTPVADGQVGELVLTNLGRLGSPLVRYRTGDLVRMLRERCACGRWFARLEGGILGRTDQMLLIRGNNVFPSAVEEVIREFPIGEFRLVARRSVDQPNLRIEIEVEQGVQPDTVCTRLGERIRDCFHFRPDVVAVEPGSLPRHEMKSKRLVFQD